MKPVLRPPVESAQFTSQAFTGVLLREECSATNRMINATTKIRIGHNGVAMMFVLVVALQVRSRCAEARTRGRGGQCVILSIFHIESHLVIVDVSTWH